MIGEKPNINTTASTEEKLEDFISQRFEELESYFNQANVTYRRKEDFEKFNVSRYMYGFMIERF